MNNFVHMNYHIRHKIFLTASVATLLAAEPIAFAESPTRHEIVAGAMPVDLGRHTFKIATKSAAAQRYFDRGLTLAYAFSHLAAEDEFRRALATDPNCAMAWWGIALVNGPHINFPAVPTERAKTALEAITKAQELTDGASKLERALIEALSSRYRDPQPENRAELDEAYAAAMRKVWKAFPKNADVATLCAEALMDLHPWDLWHNDGRPQPWTAEIVSVLERALALNADHPGANHLYIHAIEASPKPGKALAAADRLGALVPGASHLVHMPSHIYARVGRWAEAAASNSAAMNADKLYRASHPRPGFYAMYMAHNEHFLAFTSMMRGRSAEALQLARGMVSSMPEDFLQEFAQIADGYMIFPSEVLMRFGRWEEILDEPQPREGLPLSRALWHFTRAVALTALDRTDAAGREREAFQTAAAAVPKDWTFGNNLAADLLAIATKVLDGEMAARAGRLEESIVLLSEGARLQDALRYDEPPDWIQPVRHTLGAVLLRANRPADAEKVYREDLAQYPENGWSLYGLSRALRKQSKGAEASAVDARFAKAWSGADIKIDSTCHCLPGS
jgi:tetratricopeptide (TPR) repeat protein